MPDLFECFIFIIFRILFLQVVDEPLTPSRLRQLEAFRGVMRAGSVSRAAEVLSVTQPAVTKLLRSLENDINLTLFDRSRRRLVPTQEARRFEVEVDLLFTAAKRIDRFANDMRTGGLDAFRIAAMPSLGMHFLPRLLARFSLDRQISRVSITVASSLEVQDLVQAGQADLGFALPVALSGMPVAAPALHFSAVLALPPGHHLASSAIVSLAKLEGERCVLLGRQFQLGDMVEKLFDSNGVRPLYVAETQNASAACAMVAEGMGVAVVDPITAIPFAADIAIRPLSPTVDFPVQLLAPPGRPLSQLAAHFIDMLRQEPNVRQSGLR
jgi:DNA-binding transcriptional LysR family regulator